jgi:hypothetical protein
MLKKNQKLLSKMPKFKLQFSLIYIHPSFSKTCSRNQGKKISECKLQYSLILSSTSTICKNDMFKKQKRVISECKIQSSWIWLSTSTFSKTLFKKWKGNIAIPKSLNFRKLKANVPPAQLAILDCWTDAHLALQLVNPVKLHTYPWNSESQQTTKKTNPFMKLLPILGTK